MPACWRSSGTRPPTAPIAGCCSTNRRPRWISSTSSGWSSCCAAWLAGDGWGIIAVLHDLPLVKTHADRVVLFKNGRIAALGPPPDVLTTDHIHEVFDLDEPLAI